MKQLTAALDLGQEVRHLANFIRQKWEPLDNLEAIFTEIRDAALHAARGWFDQHALWECATELEDARTAQLRATLGVPETVFPELYDAYCLLLHSVSRNASCVREAGLALDGCWDIERRVDQVRSGLVAKYPGLLAARPQGWVALAENYVDFDGQAEYDPRPDHALFEGVSVPGRHAPEFPSAVALPYVMYDEVCQGTKAHSVLVGAVFAHFLGIAEYLNTCAIKEALLAAVATAPAAEMAFERNVATDHPILKTVFALATPCCAKNEFEASLAQRAAYAALSPEEKAQRAGDTKARVGKLLAELCRKSTADEEDRKYEAEKVQHVTMLRAAFGET